MNEIIFKILPPLIIFLVGFILKKVNIIKKEDCDLLLKLVFYAAGPSLALTSLSSIALRANLILLVVSMSLIIFSTFGIAGLILKYLKINNIQKGVFLIATMIMNTSFIIPFVLSVFDKSGIAMFLLIDAVMGIFTYSLIYFIAVKYGGGKKSSKLIRQKLLFSVPLWAIIIALILNMFNISIPAPIHNTLILLGNLASPLIMLSLGGYFSFRMIQLKYSIAAVILRMFGGIFLGLLFSYLLHLEGVARELVLLASAAPAGFNTLTFSSLEKLDKEFAASIISISILVALIVIPLLLIIVHQ